MTKVLKHVKSMSEKKIMVKWRCPENYNVLADTFTLYFCSFINKQFLKLFLIKAKFIILKFEKLGTAPI